MTGPRGSRKGKTSAELRKLRRLRKLLRKVMEAGHIMLMADEKTNDELIRLSGARGVS